MIYEGADTTKYSFGRKQKGSSGKFALWYLLKWMKKPGCKSLLLFFFFSFLLRVLQNGYLTKEQCLL